jgi:hypothetical protein
MVGAILSGLKTTKRAPPSVSSHNWRDIERGMQIISPMTFTKNIGMLLLAIFLILYGLIAVFGFAIGVVAGIIAILAGIFILLGR